MSKALVIVESPAKAKTINKYLGKEYLVKSSIGHIRDLSINVSNNKARVNISKNKKGKNNSRNTLINRIGIDPFHGWKAQYEILPSKEEVVKELRSLAEKVDHIYLATDLDREGEAIAWHLREVIGGDDKRFSRVIFNEITKNSITKAFAQPGELNIKRVNAQQARRFMDRIVGYMVSPLLWKKIARNLSAGRVQSVAVRLIVERERTIKTFVPKEYWEVYATLQTVKASLLTIKVTHKNGKPFKPTNQSQVQTSLILLENSDYMISHRKDKFIESKPSAPFTTSTIQQAASSYLGYSIKKTMILAQRLYEAGYITYMRTASTSLSQDALNMVRNYINASFGELYLPKTPKKYTNNNNQEAHEAIRPSNINILAEQLKAMEIGAKKLYQLIWQQFIACQMTAAQYNFTALTITAGEFQLRACGYTLNFDGWTKVIPGKNKDENQNFSEIQVGETLMLRKLVPKKLFTKPPIRYSEASLVRELEKRKIGRPSTYVSIISTIQERGYVHMNNGRFYAEKIGEIVTNRLKENFRELMDYNFTAKMEDTLDQVANNKQEWKNVLDEFFNKFSRQLESAEKDPEDGGMRPNHIITTSINCKSCGRKMGIRTARTGVFLGCSGYVLPLKERCKNTINLILETKNLPMFKNEDLETNTLCARRRCEKCKTAMDSYLIDTHKKIHICGNSPLCNGYKIEWGNFQIKDFTNPVVKCEKCDLDMYLKLGRFGKYMACTNDNCKNTRKISLSGDVAPPKEDPIPLPELTCKKSNAHFVLRHGETGIFLAANTFPESRETRAPLVSELIYFRDRLPKKLHYLADAPIEDSLGNKTSVRFSRKTKQQYVLSEKSGKPTGWTAFYVDGEWRTTKK